MSLKIDKTNFSDFKGGKYIVGDLCYLPWEDKDWEEICDDILGERTNVIIENAQCFVVNTYYGDGFYDFNGQELPVDAGIMGLISIDILKFFNISLKEFQNTQKFQNCYVIEDFNFKFKCKENDGIISLGYYDIDTKN